MVPARRVLLTALACALAACGAPVKPGTGDGLPPVTVPVNARGDWTNGAVVYELFVRSFQDSNGDGKGDLKGLISRLDYLNDGDPSTTHDLGVDAIWMMPIFESPSYHGYDTTNYELIEPDYGTNADFQTLVTEAHKRGIKLVLDFVMNHTSSEHPWFNESASSTASARRDWYVWNASNPGWKQPWGGNYPTWALRNGSYYYGVFWSGMPDLNYRNAAVKAEMKRLASLWLSRGADGFRLDAARYLVENGAGSLQQDQAETHRYWKEWAAHVRAEKPDALIVGEVWADTTTISSYYGSSATIPGGDELPLNLNFPLASEIIKGVKNGEATGIAGQLKVTHAVYAPGATDAPFLTNHDMKRVMTELGDSVGKAKNAAAITLTVPGTAFLYYGEELGAQNGTASNDESKRTPMAWDSSTNGGFSTASPWYAFAPGKTSANVANQTNDPDSILSRYRKLIRARKASAALSRGGLQIFTPTAGSSNTLVFVRVLGDERVLVAHNLTDGYATAGPFKLAQENTEPLFADEGASLSGGPGAWNLSLPPRGTGIWRIQ
ncbi:MAG TPA: alpha-amylase family glycosyl hydrolase [Myxococcaceae bacterium]|nr:alpha-amylase family glycosyl hydrolase [Myxococcaceae bacterium]